MPNHWLVLWLLDPRARINGAVHLSLVAASKLQARGCWLPGLRVAQLTSSLCVVVAAAAAAAASVMSAAVNTGLLLHPAMACSLNSRTLLASGMLFMLAVALMMLATARPAQARRVLLQDTCTCKAGQACSFGELKHELMTQGCKPEQLQFIERNDCQKFCQDVKVRRSICIKACVAETGSTDCSIQPCVSCESLATTIAQQACPRRTRNARG
jgi:hypothetical protein